MRYQSLKIFASWCLLAAALAVPSAVQGSLTVHSGWDLLITDPSSYDMATGTGWQGVPLGNWNFGGSIGMQNVLSTDTIIHRTANATAPAYDTWGNSVSVAMDALQLRSVDQVDLGAGLGYYYVTLQSVRGGQASGGTMDIYFGAEGDPHGYWNSTMDLYFDIRYGSINGPIVASIQDQISAMNVPWRHPAVDGTLLIPDVNYLLDGTDIYQDFFPGLLQAVPPGRPCEPGWQDVTFNENGTIVHHMVWVACPEPGSVGLFLCGAAALGLRRLRRNTSR